MKKVQSDAFFLDADNEWEVLGGGISRKIMGYDESIMMVKVNFEKGSIGTPHQHVHSQTTYVVSGAFEMDVEGKKQVLKGGDSFYIAPDLMHSAVCLEAGMLIDVFSPIREDFLDGTKPAYLGGGK
ncbi:cupin domain-containing protein [Persicobacter psychrovividus]|uniref:Cupin n=1 Tax=Persicobacter psychrovividus TaxID=387638 RepID=A0ABM7VIZ0_9BACT|nr:cupin [Persicobacter psychrovividus]